MSAIKMELKCDRGYEWTHYENVYCRGYAFKDNNVLEDENLAAEFIGLGEDDVFSKARELDGFFSIIVKYADCVLALADHMRSFPLFYYVHNGEFVLSDSIDTDTIRKLSLNKESLIQYTNSQYLLGNRTLLDEVYGIEAYGYFKIFSDGSFKQDFYDEISYSDMQINDLDIAVEELSKLYDETFERLIKYLNGRQAVIPLSGGHDSRLLAYYLVKKGYTNIIAFSYGNEKMSDSVISKQVAKVLNIEYYYIPYSAKRIRKAYKKHFCDYMMYSANGVSVPLLQTWYAVHWLFENKIINKDCVFCPGYGGILPGHYIDHSFVDSEYIRKDKLYHCFENEFFSRMKRFEEGYYRSFQKDFKRLDEINNLPAKIPSKKAAEIFEQWIFREDQAKGIQNATRLYEFYGAKWATPFFDKAQFDLWMNIDNKFRYDNKAFKEMEKQLYEGEICKIGYTGSKEQSVQTERESFAKRFFKLMENCICPQKAHYMCVIVPIKNHIYNTIFKRTSSPLFYIKDEYLKYIKKIKRK